MSTVGGSVPAQGVIVPETKKRNPRGTLGEGTRSLQMKRMWKLDMKVGTAKMPLKAFARMLAGKVKVSDLEDDNDTGQAVAVRWLDGKAHPPKRIPKPRIQKDAKAAGAINIPKKKGKGKAA